MLNDVDLSKKKVGLVGGREGEERLSRMAVNRPIFVKVSCESLVGSKIGKVQWADPAGGHKGLWGWAGS